MVVLRSWCARCWNGRAARDVVSIHRFVLAVIFAAGMPEFAWHVAAQEPAAAVIQPLNEPTPVPLTGIPELPETEVVARPGNFPAEPLPGDEVISPNRLPTPAGQTGSSITVISEAEIDEISPRGGQTTVAEVLRGRLGTDVVRQGGSGGLTSVFLRGANSQQTKVLLDGIPLNDPSNAGRSFDFSTLTVDNVERIEVLRGPQSMLYGSDAIGGVVNIITKRGEGPLSARASGFGGTFNTGQGALNVSGGDDVKYYSVTGSYFNTGGISSASARNGNTENDPFTIGTASGRVGINPTPNWNVDYVFRYIDSSAAVDDFDFFTGLPIDNLRRKNQLKGFSNRVQLSNWLLDDVVFHRVGFNLVDYDRRDTDSGPFVPPVFHGQTRNVDYLASVQLTETNTLTAGADYLAEDASSTFNPLVGQSIAGAYLQDAVNWGNFNGTAGVRFDEASRAGPAQTYRVTSIYNLPVTCSALHGSIGTGFRQPALAENLFQFGNPNLRPERSKGWDVGLRQSIWEDVIVADATYFRNDFLDLIIFDFNTFSLENVGRARSSGVELSLLVLLTETLSVNTIYTLNDTLNLDTGSELVRRPRDKVSLTVTQRWPESGSSVALQFLYIGDRLDTGNVVLPHYALVNLAANRSLSDAVTANLRLDNLTNTEYEEINGYGSPGFGMYGGLTLLY